MTDPRPQLTVVRRYGPVVGIVVALVVMSAVAAVGNGRDGTEAVRAEGVGGLGASGVESAGAPRGVTSWSQAEAAGTTGEIEWGERCDTERGRLAYPARHPPECYARFEGDNGGATTPGVTGDEVTVVLYQSQEHDPIVDYITGAVGSHDSNAAMARTLRGWRELYETYFETYGRKVRLVTYTGTGMANDDVAARADATEVAEQRHPFAVIGGPLLSSAFGDALVNRGIVCLDCMPDQRNAYLEAHAPYVVSWHIGPDQADRHVAEYVGKQLQGRKASHAGDPELRRRTRRFGIVHLTGGHDGDDLRPLEAALADQGVTLDQAVAYASPVDVQRDAPAVIARLRAAGVTSVLFAGDPIAPAALTRAATDQGWFPEWIVVGAGYTDSTLFARTYDQRQWAHAFGVTFLPARVDPDRDADSDAGGEADGTTDLYRWFHGEAPPAASAGLTVLDLELLYGGLQGAGPDLTPASFQQALFAGPPTPAGDVTFPVLSWGDHGFWPFPDHGGIDDATLVWWNPEARGPDEAGEQGAGMYEYVDGGRRYLPGEWPTEPLPVFEPAGAVALYDRPPVAAALDDAGAPP